MEKTKFDAQLLRLKKRILLTKKWFLFGIVVISTLGLGCKKEPESQSKSSTYVLRPYRRLNQRPYPRLKTSSK